MHKELQHSDYGKSSIEHFCDAMREGDTIKAIHHSLGLARGGIKISEISSIEGYHPYTLAVKNSRYEILEFFMNLRKDFQGVVDEFGHDLYHYIEESANQEFIDLYQNIIGEVNIINADSN